LGVGESTVRRPIGDNEGAPRLPEPPHKPLQCGHDSLRIPKDFSLTWTLPELRDVMASAELVAMNYNPAYTREVYERD
jgi:hypothetical protein